MVNMRPIRVISWSILGGMVPASGIWSQVRILSLMIPLGVGCWEAVNTLRFGSQWKVLRAWPWKVTRLLKIKNKMVNMSLSMMTIG